jgi:hypothetical protein
MNVGVDDPSSLDSLGSAGHRIQRGGHEQTRRRGCRTCPFAPRDLSFHEVIVNDL